jgi:hypothetical protein
LIFSARNFPGSAIAVLIFHLHVRTISILQRAHNVKLPLKDNTVAGRCKKR